MLTSDRGGTTMEAMCRQVHNSMVREFAYGLVWGASAKHYPQRVGLSHQLGDEDVVQIVKKKVVTDKAAPGDGKPARICDREKKAPLKT